VPYKLNSGWKHRDCSVGPHKEDNKDNKTEEIKAEFRSNDIQMTRDYSRYFD